MYGLLGTVAAGLVPLLLPQSVDRLGSAQQVGAIMAAWSLGGLTAPLWGRLADYRLHKTIILAGLLFIGLGLGLFPATQTYSVRIALAFLQGAGIAAVSTVANLLIVEKHPKEEWDQRLGYLMTVFGSGQVVGLLLASPFSGDRSGTGLYVAAGLVGLAVPVALRFIQTPAQPSTARLARPQMIHVPHVPATPASTHHHWGHISRRDVGVALKSPFGEFMVGYSLAMLAASLLFTAYPLLFTRAFDISPQRSSLGFGVAAALGILWYATAGRLSHERSPLAVWIGSLAVRFLAFGALVVLAVVSRPLQGYLAQVAFLIIVNSWSFISVSGTVLAADLAPTDEGTTMGIYNALSAIANTLGAFLTGLIAFRWGYGRLPVVAFLILFLAIVLVTPLWRHRQLLGEVSSKGVGR